MKFLLGQPHFAGKSVQVANEGSQDFALPGVRSLLEGLQYDLCNIFLSCNDHLFLPKFKVSQVRVVRGAASPAWLPRPAPCDQGRPVHPCRPDSASPERRAMDAASPA